ncbi:stemmadenine O-acetyltransferase-like [Mercurialis annua]|uniref:stemmadenine O-acetyltransferase-like n=1 Tax=Mercurialis annua TaxID=3986 RepID=UPI00215F48D4|nr:stemmadenine O-acetyltransferase-like [Mercurialis annua]
MEKLLLQKKKQKKDFFSICKTKMEIEKISESCIKPSSPTPPHLKTYKISLLDQFLAYNADIPLILFYLNDHPHLADHDFISERSELLKQSLSIALAHYYPLAGRIKDHLSVDCNDEGAYYVKARASIALSEYLTEPDHLTSMYKLLPRQPSSYESSAPGAYPVMIQETAFACGSVAIGVFASHMVMDAGSMISFIKTWAAITSSNTGVSREIESPIFDGQSVFPPYVGFPKEATMVAFDEFLIQTGNLGTRRVVFSESGIAKLKAEAANSTVEKPTRIEAVSSFLFECISYTLNARRDMHDKSLAFTYITTLRHKTIPPLPKNLFGNFIVMAPGLCSPDEMKLTSLACKVREAIQKIDVEFVKKVQSDGGFSMLNEKMKEATKTVNSDGVNFVMISSLCNLGIYDIDFGWGKPLWVTCIDLPPNSTIYVNSIVLLDSGKGRGIEAWVFLDEQDLVLFEKYEKLLQHALINPCPISNHLQAPSSAM